MVIVWWSYVDYMVIILVVHGDSVDDTSTLGEVIEGFEIFQGPLNFRDVAACHWTNITKESNEGRDFSLPSMREVQYLSIDLRALCDERLYSTMEMADLCRGVEGLWTTRNIGIAQEWSA